MNHKEKQERNKKIIAIARSYTLKDLAKMFNISVVRVRDILKSYKVKYRKETRELSESVKNIIEALNKGERQSDIARKFKVSRQYVNQIKIKIASEKVEEK